LDKDDICSHGPTTRNRRLMKHLPPPAVTEDLG
jgi:hypothetical protein